MFTPLPLDHGHLQKLVTADLVRPDHLLGAHLVELARDGQTTRGVRFAVWAPHATEVSVVGDFNAWDGTQHPMQRLDFGFWGLTIAEDVHGQRYKYRIKGADGRTVDKTDPCGTFFEQRPATASIVWQHGFDWHDQDWMQARTEGRAQGFDQPISIYEVHIGSWRKDDAGWFLNYRELAHQLGDYVRDLGYTHVELLGVMEHPLDDSWGYQVTGYYAPTSRHGNPEDFKYFVNHLHNLGIGVIVDWVPAHFPSDEFALANYDGQALYEYSDPRKGYHHDWNTYIFDYGRHEVQMFLIGSALKWLQDFHVDGLRVDAVASMLYLDFSRPADEWIPNVHGGRENLEAIAFLKRLNEVVHHMAQGCLMIAEESTAFAGVTKPTPAGLGFDYKWAMGWMHDTLRYFSKDPAWRKYHHNDITFYNLYRSTENYVLAISHDEVVHQKRPVIEKIPGYWEDRRADYRCFLAMMWTTPGKKLLFMGQEFAQTTEWNHNTSLPWHLTELPDHIGIQNLVRRLNAIYRERPDWHEKDGHEYSMQWLSADDADHSVYAFLRCSFDDRPEAQQAGQQQTVQSTTQSTVKVQQQSVVVANLTPVPRENHRIGVPCAGTYHVLLSTDEKEFGGYGTPLEPVQSEEVAHHGQPHSICLHLPGRCVLVLTVPAVDA